MHLLASVTLDQIIVAFIVTAGVREMLPQLLPISVAGPHGWLIQSDTRD